MVVTRSRNKGTGKIAKGGPAKGKVEKPSGVSKGAGPSKARQVKKKSEKVHRDENGVAYFYFRSEPTTRLVKGSDVKFSIDDLAKEPNATATWDGVRNFTARNWMREMRVGDCGLFYHSNTTPDAVGVVGTVTVVKEAYPDHTAWDSKSPYFDPNSTKDNPKWEMVDVKLLEKFDTCVTRNALKGGPLREAYMLKMGRVSVGPVTPAEWRKIIAMGKKEDMEDGDGKEKKDGKDGRGETGGTAGKDGKEVKE